MSGLSVIERTIALISPAVAVRRAHNRNLLNKYEAAITTKHHDLPKDRGSGDTTVGLAGDKLRVMARDFEQNHDIARGVLSTLVNNTVGTGIRYEPMVRDLDGELHIETNEALSSLFNNWSKKPEVTGEYSLAMAERLAARAWFRDGEMFATHHQGKIPNLKHETLVPYSVELVEADQVPFDISDPQKRIIQGVGKDVWGKPSHYYVLDGHPGDPLTIGQNGKEVKASLMLHLKSTDRIRQTRGVSVFASVLRRLGDLKDYEDSERIAARIASRLVGYIKKGESAMYDPQASQDKQPETMEKGMFLFDMEPGSEIGMVDTNRPNIGLGEYRKTQLRGVSSGTGTGNSSISKEYDGNYAAQRQEMVEQMVNYSVLEEHFISVFSKPIYEKFVQLADLASLLDLPADVDLSTLYDVQCTGTPQPWVDPHKEVKADALSVQFGFSSLSGIIRKRGGNPNEVFAQIKREMALLGHDAYRHIVLNLTNSNLGHIDADTSEA